MAGTKTFQRGDVEVPNAMVELPRNYSFSYPSSWEAGQCLPSHTTTPFRAPERKLLHGPRTVPGDIITPSLPLQAVHVP